jgi:hypothetical protein
VVGSLGTVAAPPDFDFRLRARLANDSGNGAFHYWPLVKRGFAVAAALIVLAFGVVVVRNVVNQPKEQVAGQNPSPPVQQESPKQTTQPTAPSKPEQFTAHLPSSGPNSGRSDRPVQAGPKVKRLSTVDSTFKRAEVISGSEAVASDAGTPFPIDASLQPLRLSLDDGHGNAKVISVPTIRFGSQRMLPNRNQLVEKGIW